MKPPYGIYLILLSCNLTKVVTKMMILHRENVSVKFNRANTVIVIANIC